MKNYKILGYFFLVLFCHNPQIFSMANDLPSNSEHVISIKNNSEWTVRISIGPDYPNSIAIDPAQIMTFPIEKVSKITASSYGKISHFVGVDASLDIAGLLQEQNEFSERDFTVEITYHKTEKSFWNIAKYLFTQGTWAFAIEPYDQEKIDADSMKNLQNCLREKMKQISATTPDEILQDAALVWSMFPRAAAKILTNNSVYPFNIVSLDIGGFIATDNQLRNWGNHLVTTMKQQFSYVKSPEIWHAVQTLIADAIESLRLGKHYAERDPGYLLTILHTADKQEEPTFSNDLIEQLKTEVAENSSARFLVQQLEQAAQERGWIKNKPLPAPPAPPAPPVLNKQMNYSYQEKAINNYMESLKKKLPEEQSLQDKVIQEVFVKIDNLQLDTNTVQIKYAAFDKLRGIKDTKLPNILNFLTATMIQCACAEKNAQHALQEWIRRIAQAPRQLAFEYAQIHDIQDLQNRLQSDQMAQGRQESLLALLRMSFSKFNH